MDTDTKVITQEGVTVFHIIGKLDGNFAPIVQERLLPHLIGSCRLVIALCKCDYVSSAGLRLLLMVAKQLTTQGGTWGIACATEEIRDVMDMTGFNTFFKHYPTVTDAVNALKQEGKC